MRNVLHALISVFSLTAVTAQDTFTGGAETTAEIMAMTDENEAAYVLERLSDLTEKPVSINSGDENEIARLFFLTEFQVKVLADHVRHNGDVVSLYELALLPAFDRSTVTLMAPYITLDRSSWLHKYGSEKTALTLTGITHLSPDGKNEDGIRSLLRFRHEGRLFSYGLTAENDPGESFSFRNAFGPDFLSGHVIYSPEGFVKQIIAGDYCLRFGEGLVFNSGSWHGSWLNSPSFMAGRTAVNPYTSTEENRFLRGVSCQLGTRGGGATLFLSVNSIDARLVLDGDSDAIAVSNLVSGGIHSSPATQEAHNTLDEYIAGAHLMLGTDRVRAGVTSSMTWFSLPFQPDKSKSENITAFSGDRLCNLSADFRAGTGKVLFFAEAALSLPGSWAAIGGIRGKPSARISFNVLARHFSPEYYAFHSMAFSSGSSTRNESGLAAVIHLEVAPHLFISAGADHYRVLLPKYRTSSPSCGSRSEIRAEFLPRENISLRLEHVFSSREYDLKDAPGLPRSEINSRHITTMMLSFNPDMNICLKTRVSFTGILPSGEKGFLICQDASYAFGKVPLRIWLRYAVCTTESYNSRLYAWENDLIHCFSIPAMYGAYNRAFLMISWKPRNAIELRAKYAVTSVSETLAAKVTHEARVQIRAVF